jgi:transposase-like protein
MTGPDGLLKQLTKAVIESALAEEMTEHLGHEKHDPAGAGTGNIRNSTGGKTVLTEARGRCSSRCRAIGPTRSSRRSSRSGNGA